MNYAIKPDADAGAASAYAVITPACNEAAHLPRLVRAMRAQTRLPDRWIIVDDGSTDTTGQLAKRAAAETPFIRVVQQQRPPKRDFAAKVTAINAGIRLLDQEPCAYLGILDADIEPPPTYYASILARFEQNPGLGLAGGVIVEFDGWQWQERLGNSRHSVAGAVQLFRHTCFTSIGGLPAVKFGGEDTVAEILARDQGWQVTAFPELPVRHHRNSGFADGQSRAIRLREGHMDYCIGYLPWYEMLACTRRLAQPPVLLGSCYRMFGYCRAAFRREPYHVSNAVVSAVRRQQRRRLLAILSSAMPQQ